MHTRWLTTPESRLAQVTEMVATASICGIGVPVFEPKSRVGVTLKEQFVCALASFAEQSMNTIARSHMARKALSPATDRLAFLPGRGTSTPNPPVSPADRIRVPVE